MDKRQMRLVLVATLLAVAGCGPAVNTDDLGKVVYEVPKFDPDEQAHPLPKLGPPPEDSDEDHDHAHHPR
jgi:hypothetical protein